MRVWSSFVILAFASVRQPRFKERFLLGGNKTESVLTTSDIYLQNIEKMSKSRNNPPGYIDALEKKERVRRKRQPRHTVIIPIGVDIPGLGFKKKKEERPMPKMSESGQFVLEETKDFTFTNIGGYEAVKEELSQSAHMMMNPDEYTQYGVRVPKGVLLEGPPGNGKTLMAKCFAGEIACNFVRCAGSEFNEKYIGVGSSRLRELFKFASENQPVVLFIDEFDAIGRRRSEAPDNSSGGEKDTTLNQLLVLMDGFDKMPGVLVMAATNRADILDPAVVRPGRFDKIIHIPNPDFNTRREIARIHKGSKPVDVDEVEIAQMTPGFSGAMIENMLNEAVLWGIRQKSLPIKRDTLDEIRQQLIFGSSTATRNISATTQERVATHETGHLINALCSKHYDKPVRVSINLSNKNSLGQTVFQREDEDEGIFLREYLDDKIRVLLGGRAAEEVIYGQSSSSTGSTADLETAFQLARRMLMEFGMGKHIVYPLLSEDYKKRIDDEIHSYIHRAHQEARQVILKNMSVFRIFVEQLLIKGVILEDEIQEIFRSEP